MHWQRLQWTDHSRLSQPALTYKLYQPTFQEFSRAAIPPDDCICASNDHRHSSYESWRPRRSEKRMGVHMKVHVICSQQHQCTSANRERRCTLSSRCGLGRCDLRSCSSWRAFASVPSVSSTDRPNWAAVASAVSRSIRQFSPVNSPCGSLQHVQNSLSRDKVSLPFSPNALEQQGWVTFWKARVSIALACASGDRRSLLGPPNSASAKQAHAPVSPCTCTAHCNSALFRQ